VKTASAGSLLADALELLAGETRFAVSFEDLSGISFDFPELALPLEWRQHVNAFCHHAKTQPGSRCPANKILCNRRVSGEGGGLEGLCHLGLREAVEPLRVEGRTLGVFYFGAVRLEGEEAACRRRIETHCRRRGLAAQPYYRLLGARPCVSAAEWERAQHRFRAMVRLVTRLVGDLGLPADAYLLYPLTSRIEAARRHGPVTRQALTLARQRYREALTLAGCAAAIGCHPAHLSRTFKRETGIDFHRYLHRVRINHAKRLLRHPQMNITRVAYEVGYADASHFCRVFRQLEGCTPGAYLRDPQRV